MAFQDHNNHYDVLIIGAGPAGSSCALALGHAGLRVALADRHTFPRDKVCGDAIPGRAIKCLHEMDPQFAAALAAFTEKLPTRQTACYFNNKKLDFSWALEAYTATRMSFDNFLLSLVKERGAVEVLEGREISEIMHSGSGFTVTTRNGQEAFHATLLVGADGTNGVTAKQLTWQQMDRRHHVAAVRRYYRQVGGMEDTCTEVYFDRKYLPGYFWVFPIHGGLVNAGMGVLSDDVVKKQINVKQAFYDFIERSAILRSKFRDAQPAGPLQGCGLPLGSRWVTMSGDHFLLAGDAACLIDPVSGDGIGNAVLSGKLAAEQAIRCFAAGNFSAAYLKTYEQALYKAAGADLQRKARVLKTLARMPFLFDTVFTIGKHRIVKNFLK
ncbi:geranylgeranyl reductase family protein [Chitinophaga japonensis]|uniref:Geranylgeranyl reductase family protein n=1 Tax=Chitinophaga japonensis TaxID=104662 RepID=A0A562SIR7_CHIJA|nr:geranylgeranyl reductase family protein [Chitinophaga japonensis]TWI80884.1 geranylgeranyl reductase family protein [Chitinophaga japonensis]